ncbi:MAG: pyrimidine dimer DNA glycosylase/endonuclease V [Desulfovibrio fairfieldensis]
MELHMLLGTLKKGKSITGFLSGGLIDPCRMYKRHGELVREMERRGYAHNSPLTEEECPRRSGIMTAPRRTST